MGGCPDMTAPPLMTSSESVRTLYEPRGTPERGGGPLDVEMMEVPIRELTETLTPRSRGGDMYHARTLAESYERLPPVLVHRDTMAVIDGVHRLIASKLLGQDSIRVTFFDGTEFDAYVEGVRVNSTHGKPLSLEERRHAARKVLAFRPEWSDRRVAETCGISPGTVAAIRGRATGEPEQLSTRVGRDGKKRPTDPGLVRLQIADLIRKEPHTSSRSLAATVASSQATVLDVRRRVERGESPLPAKLQEMAAHQERSCSNPRLTTEDPALVATDEGRDFCRWFDRTRITSNELEEYVAAVPLSRVYLIADEARARSATWSQFATQVETRARKLNNGLKEKVHHQQSVSAPLDARTPCTFA